MKKSKIAFIVIGLMLVIHAPGANSKMSTRSSVPPLAAKQHLPSLDPASAAQRRLFADHRHTINVQTRSLHLINNQLSPFFTPHSVTEKLLFPFFTREILYHKTDWFPSPGNFHQNNSIPQSSLASYPYYTAGVQKQWERTFESRTLPGHDVATDVAVDDQDNVYVTGYSTSLPQGIDFFTIKYDAFGNLVWSAYYNGEANGDDQATQIDLDENNNVYVGGTSSGSGSGLDFVVIKYNNQGQQQWVVRYNSSGQENDELQDMIVDGLGNVYLTGKSNNRFNTVKFNSAGVQQWAMQYQGPANYDLPNAIAIDQNGNVYVAGESVTSARGYYFAYVTIKYNPEGVQLWTTYYTRSDSSSDVPYDITVDKFGNVYVTGTSWHNENYDYLTVKYNENGELIWAAIYDGSGNPDSEEYAHALTLDKEGNVYVTGTCGDMYYHITTIKYNPEGKVQWLANYGKEAETFIHGNIIISDSSDNIYVAGGAQPNGGGYDFLIVKYDRDGHQQWMAQYDGTNHAWDQLYGIAVNNKGEILVTGKSENLVTASDFITVNYNSAGIQQWERRFNGTNSEEGAAVDVVVDGIGNIIVFGVSGNQFITTKYTAQGTALWATSLAGREYNYGNNKSLAVDPLGNVFVIIADRVDSSEWNYDFLTIKYDANGVQQWTARYSESEWHETGFRSNIPVAIVVNKSGNAFVTGKSPGKTGGFDVVTIKYHPDGTEQWRNRFRSSEGQSCEPTNIAIDCDDNVYVSGSMEAVPSSLFIIKYNSQGEQQWIATYEETKFLFPPLMALDNWGNIYLVSNKSKYSMLCELLEFDDCIIVKYNQNGIRQWVTRFTESDQILIASNIGIDEWGNVYICGAPWKTNLEYCYITKKYSADGIELWKACYATTNVWIYPGCLTLDRDGNVYVAGSVDGYGTGSDIAVVKYTPAGKESWSIIYNDSRNTSDRINEMVVDFWGNVYLAGMAEGTHWSNFKTIKISQTGGDSLTAPELDGYQLLPNIPNPFRKQTVIYYQLPRSSHVTIKVFNSLGQQVLFKDLGQKPVGKHSYYFLENNLPSGVYFYQLKTDDFVKTRKMVLIR